MDELGICTQITAIMANVTGITKAFDYDETPPQLNDEDLPAAVTLIGPMAPRDVMAPGGKAAWGIDEALTFIIRIYVLPNTQGLSLGEAVAATGAFLSPVLDAFDGRPKLINATGGSTSAETGDFDYDAAGVLRAFIVASTGIIGRPHGAREYWAVEFSLRVDGKRVTAKVEGN